MARPLLAGRRVRVVGCFDSFLKAARPLANALESHGATVSYDLVFARPRQLSARQRRDAGVPQHARIRLMDAVVSRFFQHDVDVVLVAHSGMRTQRLVARTHAHAARCGRRPPVLISFYPGLLFRMQLEGMMARSGCDLILLNSPHDQALYRSAMDALGRHDNSMLSGLSFVGERIPEVNPRTRYRVVFAGQPTVPAGKEQRREVVRLMAEAARRHPSLLWVIKPRHRKTETTLHRERYWFEDFVDELVDLPRNLVVDHTPLRSQIESALCCITFSSTAALESAAQGIPTRVITDLGIDENLGNHFFLGSGLLGSIGDVTPEIRFELAPEWRDRHLYLNHNLSDELGAKVQQLLIERDRV